MQALRLEKKLPPSHRGGFWSVFIDAVDFELQNLYARIGTKKSFFNVHTMEVPDLIDLSSLLGVTFDANLISTPAYIRGEVAEAPFKILYKDTPALYLSFAKAVNRQMQLFVYYYKAISNTLVRSALDPLTYIGQYVVDGKYNQIPWTYYSTNNFTGQEQTFSTLDAQPQFQLDSQLNALILDNLQTTTSTNHLGFEYEIDRLVFTRYDASRGGQVKVSWLAVAGASTYNVYWGSSSFITKLNSLFLINTASLTYTHAGTTDGQVYYYMVIALDSLGHEIGPATVQIPFLMTNEYLNYLTDSVVPVRRVKEVPHVGSQLNLICDNSGSTNTIAATLASMIVTPDYADVVYPVQAQLVEVHFGSGSHDLSGNIAPASLAQDVTTIPVNFYETGESGSSVSLGFVWASGCYAEMNTNNLKIHDASGFLGDPVALITPLQGSGRTGVDHVFTGTLPSDLTYLTVPPKFIFTFTYNGALTTIIDDGLGNLTGQLVASGSMIYYHSESGPSHGYCTYTFTLSSLTDPVTHVTTQVIPDPSTSISVMIQTILPPTKITEAGLFAKVGLLTKLIAYATFPPIEVSAAYHLNIQFMIDKGTF